jgi:hypothetical protein
VSTTADTLRSIIASLQTDLAESESSAQIDFATANNSSDFPNLRPKSRTVGAPNTVHMNNQNHLARYTKKLTYPASKFTTPTQPLSGSPLRFNVFRNFGVSTGKVEHSSHMGSEIGNGSQPESPYLDATSFKEREREEEADDNEHFQDEEQFEERKSIDQLGTPYSFNADLKIDDEPIEQDVDDVSYADETLDVTENKIRALSQTLNEENQFNSQYDLELKEISSDPYPYSNHQSGFTITLLPLPIELDNNNSIHTPTPVILQHRHQVNYISFLLNFFRNEAQLSMIVLKKKSLTLPDSKHLNL